MFRHLLADFLKCKCCDSDNKTLNFDISLDDLDIHSRSQFFEKLKNFSLLTQSVDFLKLMLSLFCTSDVEGREIC